MSRLTTLQGHEDVGDKIMCLVFGIFLLAAVALVSSGIYVLIINIDLKLYAFWGSIGLVTAFVAWNAGYWAMRHMSIGCDGKFKCGCGYIAKHPLVEIFHKRRCLSYILNGKNYDEYN